MHAKMQDIIAKYADKSKKVRKYATKINKNSKFNNLEITNYYLIFICHSYDDYIEQSYVVLLIFQAIYRWKLHHSGIITKHTH